MIVIDNAVISDDVSENYFVCDLNKCKGACCVEGDLGAPLEEDELAVMRDIQEKVKPYLTKKGKAELERQGPYVHDEDGDYSTPTINGRECAYAVYEKGILKCGIEKAWRDGVINFRKPISCHLYPIRITKYNEYEALNYDRWHICNPACHLGKSLETPLYVFLKEALIRKYGEVWYEKLVAAINEVKDQKS